MWLLFSEFPFLHKCIQSYLAHFFTFAVTKRLKNPTDTVAQRLPATKYPTNKMSNMYKPKNTPLQSTQKHHTDTVAQGL